MPMNVPIKPADYDLEAQPVYDDLGAQPDTPTAAGGGTAAGATGSEHSWVPNVAYMVAGAAIFFDSWDTTQKRKWCLSHDGDSFTDKEQDEYDRHCALMTA